jgi:WD40 repeat protein
VLAAGDERGTFSLLRLDSGVGAGRVKGHEGMVKCIAFSPDSRYLATGSADTTILIWDLARFLPHR